MSRHETIAANEPQRRPASRHTEPMRIGIAGLGRVGRHHIERIGLRSDIEIVGTHDPAPCAQNESARLRFGDFHASWRDLLRVDHLDAVLIATPLRNRKQLVVEALDAGKHVLVESPMCATIAELQTMRDAARRSGRVLSVSTTRIESDDFRTAHAAMQSGELGQITAARLMIWGLGIGRDARAEASATDAEIADVSDLLSVYAAHHVDQLLTLVAAPVSSVFAHISQNAAVDGRSACSLPAFSLMVQFIDGQTGLVDRNFASLTSVNTGWVLDGTRGGYQNARRFAITEAGEIYDHPVDIVPADWDRSYTAFLSEVQEGQPLLRTAAGGAATVQVLEAATESVRRNDVVQVATA